MDHLEQMYRYHIMTTYLETLAGLPWTERTDDHVAVTEAEEILDSDHFGLDKVPSP